jgi:hypothetical protein
MISFKEFVIEQNDNYYDLLNESEIADDVNKALEYVASIDAGINSIKSNTKYNKSNSKRIFITQYVQAGDRSNYVNKAIDIINSNKDLILVDVGPVRAIKDFAFSVPDINKVIYVATKPTGKSTSPDPNELMTAAISCISGLKVPKTVEEADSIISKAQDMVKTKVKDYRQVELDSFEKNYGNSAAAISAAIAIQKYMGGPAETAYMTAKTWNKDISMFKKDAYGMKDFNSSDIVFKRGNNWFGISLKKKELTTLKDPTLVNKAFTSLLAGKNTESILKDINETTAEFFVSILTEAKNEGILNRSGAITKNNWKLHVSKLDTKYVNSKLKGRESLFNKLANVIDDNSEIIANNIIQLSLKLDLKDLKKHDFHFALVTGIGSYGVKKGVVVKPGELKDIDTIVGKIDKLFSSGKPNIVLDTSKKQAYDEGATAASLAFILRIGTFKVLEIIIRYKGVYTTQPQFLSYMTDDFKKLLGNFD